MKFFLLALLVLIALTLLFGLICKLLFGWTWKKYFDTIFDWFDWLPW
jgi:hypothetical protein